MAIPLNSVDSALNALFAMHWLDAVAARLSTLHRERGQPCPPEVIFGRAPMQLPFMPYEHVGNLNGYESQAVEAFNAGVKAAYCCIDWHYLGLLTALANETKGTEHWSDYYQAAKAELDKYFGEGSAFEDFDAYVLAPARETLGIKP